ncbi:uncharacterized protein LOC112499877 [Cynara cardunculus var. scolymus]|uniref:Uncharacterized protein n=1 Tax=Cynara cardunculus var. scolymus TaxID=59895 RepID=A0A103Y360_CYNCS|nr:uncharacterized protein LOC112499877 [Cynara cardunculus var. scolymus]KVI01656.1 hypothetical protein Ccrd_020065 [Cynara cardunculus var. scolymus]
MISSYLLHTILELGATAQMTWDHLKETFQDKRVVHLKHQFSHTHQTDFLTIYAYCQHLKMLSDQLANVGARVTNQRLVLQLIFGFSKAYDRVATIIQQFDALALFYRAKSMLTLEGTRKAKQASISPDTHSALFTTGIPSTNIAKSQPRVASQQEC